MTPEREVKRIQRTLRTIPVDAIASEIASEELDDSGLWCVVAGVVTWVTTDGHGADTIFCDPLIHAQYVRWLASHPERVHASHASALEFVRSRLSGAPD